MSKFLCGALLFVVSSLTTVTASAAASHLGVVAYSMPDGANLHGAYYDNSYSGTNSGGFLSGGVGDLTDGVESASVSAGYGAWAPYVLWDGQSPVITFDLGVSSSVSEINTFFKYYPSAAVYIPESIGIRVSSNGTSFTSLNPRTFSETELAPGGNDANGIYQLLSTPATGRYFELTLNNQPNNRWLALSEVTFKGSVAPVPEPETYAMLLAGLGLIGAVAKRRKVKQI